MDDLYIARITTKGQVTVDTNVLISALGWNGAEAALIEAILDSKIELCLSAQILSEFYRVAQYPKFNFTDEEVDGFIGRLLSVANFVKPVSNVDIIADDPDDNMIIECALDGAADYIISGDRHLLQLGNHLEIKIMRASEDKVI